MAKKQPKYNWETQFDTANNIMHHTFTDRVEVKANIKNGEILVLIDGHIINTYYNMPVKAYEALLLGVEQYAYQLERKDRIKAFWFKVAVYAIITIGLLAFFALGGDNDSCSLGVFAAQKAACIAIMGCCWLSIKHTKGLAMAWENISKEC